jgi:hypothetical protein
VKPVDSLSEDEFAELVRRAVALPDAPRSALRAAIELRPAPLQGAARAVMKRVAAALSFDSWAPAPLALGVRAVPSDTRHLLFSAMGRDIDVRITPAADHFALAGQILGPDESGTVELVSQSESDIEARSALVATLDALGEFRLDGVSRGTYLLTLRLGSDEIVLPPIEVGERRS